MFCDVNNGEFVAAFAISSASSFPGIPIWLGTHRIFIFGKWLFINPHILAIMYSELSIFFKASIIDSYSVQIHVFPLVFIPIWKALRIAVASAAYTEE